METPTNPENQIIDQNISANITQKNNYKILFLIFLTLFLVVSSILAILLFNQKTPNISKIIEIEEQKTVPTEKPNSEITENSAIPTTKLTTTPAPSSASTSNFKKYTNPTYKFSLSYPSTWTIDTKSVDNRILSISSPEKIKSINDPNKYEGYSGDDFFIEVYKKTLADCQDLESCFESTADEVSNVRKVKIGKLDGYLVDISGMATEPTYFIFNSTNLFKFTSFLHFSETEKQILNTLTFN